jgi:hypothetical protein
VRSFGVTGRVAETLVARSEPRSLFDGRFDADRSAVMTALRGDARARVSDDPMPVPPGGGDVLLHVAAADRLFVRIYKRPMRAVSPVLDVRLEADGAGTRVTALLVADAAWPGELESDELALVDEDLGVVVAGVLLKGVASALRPLRLAWRVRKYRRSLRSWLLGALARL